VRFPLFLHGAAPVQASYMGYPGPNGARFLHHTYVDALVAPVQRAAASFTERLALLPHTYYLSDYAARHRQLLQPPSPSADALPRSVPRRRMCTASRAPHHVHRMCTGACAPRVRRVCTAPYVICVRVQVPLLCSLNQLPKLDPSLFATWLNALSRAAASPGPPTRLWLLRKIRTPFSRISN
tara:strand:+ start:104 stop:649 length:546 start_codon:yes stop_codon:yes gene_type:complete